MRMEEGLAISVKEVAKVFKIPHDRQPGLKGTLLNIVKGKHKYDEFYALKDISFDVKKGEFVGIIGRNGSGKTTLLKLMAGILKPTSGSITVNGKIAPFLELGLGFQEELTGKENVYLYGAVLGLSKRQIDEKYKEIVEFAELEEFMHTKLKNYSSGMQARLAFSIAIQVESDILLIDEVLAVGDISYQQKCFDYFERVKGNKTIILVSHDLNLVNRFCERSLLLQHGDLPKEGKTEVLVRYYTKSK